MNGGDLSLVAGRRVLAAVSGGPDSTALLLWLLEHDQDVVAVHFDHALRPGSEADAGHVARLCAGLGVDLVSERRREPLPPGSRQAAARLARYAFFERTLWATGRDVVALGHTADDVVEGAVLHLLRGSGLAGLRGMPERRDRYVRPMLGVWRRDVERYLGDRGVVPLEDPSNEDAERFARARVRHRLLPRLERDRPGITRRFYGAALQASRLQAEVETAAAALTPYLSEVRTQPAAVRAEFFRQLYSKRAPLPALSRHHLDAMDRLVAGGRTGRSLDLPNGLCFRILPDAVSIDVKTRPPDQPPPLVVRSCKGCDDPGAVHLRPGQRLTTGFRRPGLRIRPHRTSGTRKLQDILTDARVPRHERDRLPLVFAGGRLAAVPGIAVDADAAVCDPHRPALHVSFLDWPPAVPGM